MTEHTISCVKEVTDQLACSECFYVNPAVSSQQPKYNVRLNDSKFRNYKNVEKEN